MSATTPAVRERPILFSAPMVRSILADQKTRTRRVITPQPEPCMDLPGRAWYQRDRRLRWCDYTHEEFIARCPYGAAGDRLWVRETLRGDGQPGNRRVGIVRYGADGEMVLVCCGCGSVHCTCFDEDQPTRMDLVWEWERPVVPSIFMPRWASRITLELTGVRVERVQDISIGDARAEGITEYGDGFAKESDDVWRNRTSVENFASVWDSINAKRDGGKYAWAANPWVWAVAFRKVEGPTA